MSAPPRLQSPTPPPNDDQDPIEKALPALIADTKDDIKQKSMDLARTTPTDITYMDK
ncbi:unnamed protein product [Absidia cylindrospora]